MKPLLLDTHVVIWWLAAPRRLRPTTCARIERAEASVSVVSLWEMLLKQESGKLKLPPGDLPRLIEAQGFRLLPLRAEHAQAAAHIGGLHANPYDRLMIGTARSEQLVLVTRDGAILERAASLLGDLLLEA